MSSERFQKIERLFNEACSLMPEERASYLDRACGGDANLRASVEAMLAQDSRTTSVVDPEQSGSDVANLLQAVADAAWEEAPHPDSAIPDRVGNYRVIRCLGEGGMGIVFEAEQERPRRRVALKVIRNTMTRRQVFRRFELEAQVLGSLQHPGIAQIYEAGSAPVGETVQPFLAMEFVDGVPITEYLRKQKLGVRSILELFCKLCDAVQYAHQKGVIHRDLKPPNILVTESGQPKVLDFGVARVTDSDMQVTTQQTDIGQLIGTLQYMSPEQANADASQLDTRSDVYALGMLLYELLAGQLPYDLSGRSIADAVHIIREQSPTSLRTINRDYRGDIETIVLKAIDKDRDRRYASAAEFAADIRRHLQRQPIDARPPSTLYQLTRFAQRHRGMAAAVLITFIALVAGATTATYGLFEARQERNKANRQAAIAQAVNSFLTGLFEFADPSEARGGEITARQLLDRGAARIADELANQPVVQARMMSLMGEVYQNLGLLEPATPLIENALATQREAYGDMHLETAATARLMARTLLERGDHAEAEALFREVLDTRRALLGNDHPDVAESASNLAEVYLRTEDLDSADTLLRESLAILRKLKEDTTHHAANKLHNLGSVALARGNYEEAASLYGEALEINRRAHGADHPNVVYGLNALGLALRNQGDHATAQLRLREGLALGSKLWGPDNARLAALINNLALALQDAGQYAEAEPLLRRLLEIDRRDFGDNHPMVAQDLSNLGALLDELGRTTEAEEVLSQALDVQREQLGEGHSETLATMNNLASVFVAQRRDDDAEALYKQALEISMRELGDEHPRTLTISGNLAALYIEQERYTDAFTLLTENLAVVERTLGGDSPRAIAAHKNLAKIHEAQHRYADAERHYAIVLAQRRQSLGPTHFRVVQDTLDLAAVMKLGGKHEEAVTLLRDTYDAVAGTKDSDSAKRLIEAIAALEE